MRWAGTVFAGFFLGVSGIGATARGNIVFQPGRPVYGSVGVSFYGNDSKDVTGFSSTPVVTTLSKNSGGLMATATASQTLDFVPEAGGVGTFDIDASIDISYNLQAPRALALYQTVFNLDRPYSFSLSGTLQSSPVAAEPFLKFTTGFSDPQVPFTTYVMINSVGPFSSGVSLGAGSYQLTGLLDSSGFMASNQASARLSAVATLQPIPPGDADGDGTVDFADLLILAQHYGSGTDQTYSTGDFNNDGAVGFDDLLVLAQDYGSQAAAATTSPELPEPASLAVVLLALMRQATRCKRLPRSGAHN